MTEFSEVSPAVEKKAVSPLKPQAKPANISRGGFFSTLLSEARQSQQLRVKPQTRGAVKLPPSEITRREALRLIGQGTVDMASVFMMANSLGIKPWELIDVIRAIGKIGSAQTSALQAVAPPQPEKETESSVVTAGKEIPSPKPDAFNLVFGDLSTAEKEEVKKQMAEAEKFVASNSGYPVTAKWERVIRENAKRVGFPEELALGIIFIENGGGEDVMSSKGARGVAQLMPATARQYGLTVDQKTDERVNPQKSIAAMANYLKDIKDQFAGNLGLAAWCYNAGEGNVYDALQVYFKNTRGVDLGDIRTGDFLEQQKKSANYVRFLREKKPNVYQVLSNPLVQQNVLVELKDETERYVYRVVAAANFMAGRTG